MTMAEYLKSVRTTTQEQVNRVAVIRESRDLTRDERVSLRKGHHS